MTRNEELKQIMETEVDLVTGLLNVVRQKQEAIIQLKGADVARHTLKEEELLKPLQGLELERVKCYAELAGLADQTGATVSTEMLLSRLPGQDADDIKEVADRLREAVRQVVTLNGQNSILLDNSLKFVQKTLRIVTDDLKRQLVDERI